MEQDDFKPLFQSSEPHFVLEMAAKTLHGDRSKQTPWVAVAASRAAGLLRNWQAAADWAERGLGFRTLDKETSAWLHYFSGTSAMHLGDLGRSERELKTVENLAQGVPGLAIAVAKSMFNLAILMQLTNRFDEQTRYFQKALDAFSRQGLTSLALRCHLEIAWSYLLAGMPLKALPELTAVQPEIMAGDDGELRLNLDLALALLHSLRGEVDRSQELARGLLSSSSPDDGLKADAAWIMASNCKALGDWEMAAELAEDAHHYAWMDYWQPRIERVEALRNILRRH